MWKRSASEIGDGRAKGGVVWSAREQQLAAERVPVGHRFEQALDSNWQCEARKKVE